MENKERIKSIGDMISHIENNENQILFYVPNLGDVTTASVLTTYKYAYYLHENGKNVAMIHDDEKYKIPSWIGEEFKEIKHLALNSGKVKVSIVDTVIYSESQPDVMEKTKGLSCLKVVLCQTYKNILGSLPPGMDWETLGIDYVITVSDELKNFVDSIFHLDDYFITVIKPSVDSTWFYEDVTAFRKPVVPVLARTQSDILMLAKQFYLMYPEYKMVSFKDMRLFDISDYADTLNEAFLGIWLDRDASFGQFPIECYKTNLPIIALKTEMSLDYKDNKDLKIEWVDSKIDIPKMVFERFVNYLNEVSEPNENIAEDLYSTEDEKNSVIKFFDKIVNKRSIDLENYKKELEDGKED